VPVPVEQLLVPSVHSHPSSSLPSSSPSVKPTISISPVQTVCQVRCSFYCQCIPKHLSQKHFSKYTDATSVRIIPIISALSAVTLQAQGKVQLLQCIQIISQHTQCKLLPAVLLPSVQHPLTKQQFFACAVENNYESNNQCAMDGISF
jgi:hypothetical protein